MDLDVVALGTTYKFRLNEESSRLLAPIVLPEWEPFRSENSAPGLEGERCALECYDAFDADGTLTVSIEAYARALTFFLSHRDEIAENVLVALVGYVRELREYLAKHGLADEEMFAVSTPGDLRKMIDLSFIHLFPHQKGGVPYLGLEFECNWDPEHACGVILLGSAVLECGQSSTARGGDFDVERHGGAI